MMAGSAELFQLTGKTALVTGGGGGLGRAICRGFAMAGARVAIADVAVERARETADLIRGMGAAPMAEQLDVTNKAAVDDAVARVVQICGSLDVIVNSAGRALRGTALD